MSEQKDIINILNLYGEIPSNVQEVISGYNTQVHTEMEGGVDYKILLIDHVDNIPEHFKSTGILVLAETVETSKIVDNKNVISFKIVGTKIVNKLLSRFLGEEFSLHVEQNLANDVDYFESFKVNNHFQSGYYSDLTVMNAQKRGFNFISIRLYLTYLMTFFSYLKDAKQIRLPVDFDLAGDENTFMIQAHCYAKDFQLESIEKSIGVANIQNPVNGLLKGSLSYCHLFDVYYIQKSERLVITSVWINDSSKSLATIKGTLFKVYDQLSGKIGAQVQGKIKKVISKTVSEVIDEDAALPGEGFAEVVLEAGSEIEMEEMSEIPIAKALEETLELNKKEPVMANELNRIIEFIIRENKNGIVTYNLKYFDKEFVDWFLAYYPEQGVVVRLNEKNYQYILSYLKDDDFIDKMKDSVKAKSPAELADYVNQAVERNLKDENFLIELNKKKESRGEEQVDINQAIDKIKEEVSNARDTFETVEDLHEKTKELVKEQLAIDDDEAKELVDKIMLESIQDYIDALEKTDSDVKVDKKYVIKMMKVIQSLKNKIIELEGEDEDGNKNSVVITDLRNKVAEQELNSENKDKIIKELNKKIDDYKSGTIPLDSSGAGDDSSEKLKEIIRGLEGQLELYQERVTILSDKLDKNGNKGDLLFKNAQSGEVIEASEAGSKLSILEKHNKKLEERLRLLEDSKNKEILKLKEDLQQTKMAPSSLKFEEKILELKRENKKAIDELKNEKLQTKGLTQKLRVSQKQIERLQKQREQNQSRPSNDKTIDARSAHKIKQLEMLATKAQKKSAQLDKELRDRKLENTRLKQEMGAMKNKMEEFKRRLSKNKNAA